MSHLSNIKLFSAMMNHFAVLCHILLLPHWPIWCNERQNAGESVKILYHSRPIYTKNYWHKYWWEYMVFYRSTIDKTTYFSTKWLISENKYLSVSPLRKKPLVQDACNRQKNFYPKFSDYDWIMRNIGNYFKEFLLD